MPYCMRPGKPGEPAIVFYGCSWSAWWSQAGRVAHETLSAWARWVVDAINAIKKALRTALYYLEKALAKWLSTDWGILTAVLAAIAVVILAPQVASLLAKLPMVIKIKAWVASIKQGVGVLLYRLHLTELAAISKILEAIWPEYRRIVRLFENAIGDLSEQLGYGSAMAVAIFGDVRSIMHASYSILGMDPKAKELAWFDSTQGWLERIDKNFYKYAYDPGALIDDVIEDLVIPASKAATDAQLAALEDAKRLDERATEIADNLQLVVRDVDHIVATLPDDMTKHFMEHWEPISRDLNKAIEAVRADLLDRYSDVVEAWDEYARRQDEITSALALAANQPLAMMRNLSGLPIADQAEFARGLSELYGRGSLEALEEYSSGERSLASLAPPPYVSPAPGGPVSPGAPPAYAAPEPTGFELAAGREALLGLEAAGDPYAPGKQAKDGRSWYVGE